VAGWRCTLLEPAELDSCLCAKLVKTVTGFQPVTGFQNVSPVIEFIALHVNTAHATWQTHGALAGGTGST